MLHSWHSSPKALQSSEYCSTNTCFMRLLTLDDDRYTFPGGGVLPEYRMRPDDKARVLAYDGAEPALQEEDAAWYRALDGRPSFERLAVTDLHPAWDAGVDAEHLGADEHTKAYLGKLDSENGYRSSWPVDGKRVRCVDCGGT